MKIGSLALGNAIKCGSKTNDYLSARDFDMELDGIIIKIVSKATEFVCYTTLFNTKWWHPLEQPSAKDGEAPKGKRK